MSAWHLQGEKSAEYCLLRVHSFLLDEKTGEGGGGYLYEDVLKVLKSFDILNFKSKVKMKMCSSP